MMSFRFIPEMFFATYDKPFIVRWETPLLRVSEICSPPTACPPHQGMPAAFFYCYSTLSANSQLRPPPITLYFLYKSATVCLQRSFITPFHSPN